MDTRPGRAKDGERRRLSSVATAIELLKAFSEDEVEIGISTLAKRLGVAKSTAHRLASTLVAENLLEQDRATGKYRLGLAAKGDKEVRVLTELKGWTGRHVGRLSPDGTKVLYTDADPADDAEDARLSARADGAVNATAAARARERRGSEARMVDPQRSRTG